MKKLKMTHIEQKKVKKDVKILMFFIEQNIKQSINN